VPGTFFLVRKDPGDWVHVGIVTSPNKESFDTAEGNTDSGGSSNGFEAAGGRETTGARTLSSGRRRGLPYSFATEMSGASSFFMPTTW
jgi:hypothetical protein